MAAGATHMPSLYVIDGDCAHLRRIDPHGRLRRARGSNYLVGTAPNRRRLRKAEASDAGNVVVLACARTPR